MIPDSDREMQAAIAPEKSPNFYFVSDKCGKIWYAKTKNEFDQTVVPKMNTGNC